MRAVKRMKDGSWQQVRRIFDDALRQKPEERARFVSAACGGDKGLLAEVESLLAAFESAESFMETPAIVRVAGQFLNETRQLANGQFLTHYEIIELLGAGGMGEVYLARDTKLHRRVAIKVLRRNLLSDERAGERLLREARAAALLEHPHICEIHEIAEAGDYSFIVMRYVEGETLSDMLARGRLSRDTALELAIQIADALAEAHARGIIHRDIKPANIIVNAKGQAKVLDFGLAKFVEAEIKEETAQRLESSGAVMGTVPFMSPEQLRGQRLDARTDIFSCGALFYEMLTGRQPFARESSAETISAILNDEPSFEGIPLELQPVLRKTLMKNKDARYSSARDLTRDLADLQKGSEILSETAGGLGVPRKEKAPATAPAAEVVSNGGSGRFADRRFYFWKSSDPNIAAVPETARPGSAPTTETSRTRFDRATVLLAALTIFSVAGAAAAVFWQLNKTDDSRLFDALGAVKLVSWKTAGGYYTDYRVSHNGKLIAYSSSQEGGNENIYVKQTADGEELRVTRDEWTNVSPVWSPDDQRIAYVSRRENQTGIYAAPALGGAAVPLKITGQNEDIRLRHWSRDGAAIFYELGGNLFRLDLPTEEIAPVTDFAPAPGTERYFSLSPDEDRIAFCDKTDGKEDVWMMPVKGGEKRRLTDDGSAKRRPRWHPDGRRILYNVRRGEFQQIGLAYADGTRAPVQVTRGDSQYEMIDVSADGTKIFYFAIENRSDIAGVKTETGEEFEVAAGTEYENWAAPAPDGRAIAYQAKNVQQFGKPMIVVKQFGASSPHLTLEGSNPRWLADSRRLSFLRWSEAEKKQHLFVVNTANGEQTQVTTGGVQSPSFSLLPMNRGEIQTADWLPDGSRVLYLDSPPKTVRLASLSTGETTDLTANENANLRYTSPLFSPDGRRVVFVSREIVSERLIFRLWLWEAGAAKELFTCAGGLRLLGWAEDKLLLATTDGVMKAVPTGVKLMRVAPTGENRLLTTFKNIYANSLTLSADGKRLAFVARRNDRDDIWTVPATGGEPKKITANSGARLYLANPVFSPDGATIFFDKQEKIETISMLENFK